MSLPQRTEGRWVFRAGFLTPGSALEGACKLTLKLLHAVYPWKSAAITPPHPAAPRGHTGSVSFPFCFYVARFPPNSGQFCFLGASAALIVLHLCLPVQGEVKASLPQSPSRGGRCGESTFPWCFPLSCDCRLWYSTKRSFLFRGISF